MQKNPHKPKGRWTLLFVDEQGNTLSFKRLKGLLIVGVILLLLCAGGALTMALLYIDARDAKQELAVKLDEAFEAYQHLKEEKDRLVARLVLKQSGFLPRQGSALTVPSAAEKAKEPARQAPAAVQLPEKQPTASKPPAQEPKLPDPAPASSSASQPSVASIDFLKVTAAQNQHKIMGQLRVRNQRSRSEALEGYAFVLFQNQQQRWTAYPAVEVTDGKPAKIQQGHYFKVANYKTLSFKAAVSPVPQRFKQAIVYIFSPDGGLLLQERFPVALAFEGQPDQPTLLTGRTARESLPKTKSEVTGQAASPAADKAPDRVDAVATAAALSPNEQPLDRQEPAAHRPPINGPGASTPPVQASKTSGTGLVSSSASKKNLVGIDFLKATALHAQRKIRGQLRVRNQRSRSEPLEGYAFVSFKNQQQRWAAYPAVAVTDGKPAKIQQGHYFKVANYKTLSFKAAVSPDPQRFEQAIVYIFSPDGSLLLQERFPVALAFEGQPEQPPQATGRTGRESLPGPQTTDPAYGQTPVNTADQGDAASTVVASSAEAKSGWPDEAAFSVHVDSFQDRQQALQRLEVLGSKKYDCFMVSSQVRGMGLFHRIFVGRFANKTSAASFAAVLRGREEFDQDIHVVSKSWALGQQ